MLLMFKLVTTPLLILAVSLLARRFGPAMGGLLIGIPLTTGPISFFLAVEHGAGFAAHAAIASLVGQVSTGAFCWVYALASQRSSPWISAAAGLLGFLATTTIFAALDWNLAAASVVFAVGLILIATYFPTAVGCRTLRTSPAWDLPLRMGLGAGFVIALTALSNFLGAELSGLIAPMPVIALVLAIFIHAGEGKAAVTALLRGVVFGSPAFGAFFLTLAVALDRMPLAVAYGLAAVASLIVSASIGLAQRRGAI